MNKVIVMLISVVILATSVQAATYKWMDDQGTINFTEDPGNIPQKYRKKAKIVGEDDTVDAGVEKKDAGSGGKIQEPTEVQGAAPAAKQENKKAVYGGKDATAWKSEFSRLGGELKSVDEQLDSKRTLFSDSSKLSRAQYKSLQYDIKNLEQLREDILTKLKSLRNEATKEGVPAELQQ